MRYVTVAIYIFCFCPLRTPLMLNEQNGLCQHGDKLFNILAYFNCSMYSLEPHLLPLFHPCSYNSIKFLLAILCSSSLEYSNT